MGFIAYQLLDPSTVRLFMECQQEGEQISFTYAVEVQFPPDRAGCRLSGVESILALKKFYKLVFSLEERARERNGDWRTVFDSRDTLVVHLAYTKNARRLDPQATPRLRTGPTDPT